VRLPFRKGLVSVACVLALAALAAGCGRRDKVEEHRKLSLRLEHRPPLSAVAGEETELHALVQSSLEGPRPEAWVRILGAPGTERKIPMEVGPDGRAACRLEGQPRGTVIDYVIEARDAAGLVVSLPNGAADGKSYTLRFEGESSPLLGGISFLAAIFASVFFLGAGAAGVQCLRGRMSPGPAGLLGGAGAVLVVVGLLGIGGIHAFRVSGHAWPSSPVFFSLSRLDLAIVTLLWIATLFLGRRALLDEDAGGKPPGERAFAMAAVAGGVLTLLFLLF